MTIALHHFILIGSIYLLAFIVIVLALALRYKDEEFDEDEKNTYDTDQGGENCGDSNADQ